MRLKFSLYSKTEFLLFLSCNGKSSILITYILHVHLPMGLPYIHERIPDSIQVENATWISVLGEVI